MFSLRFVKATSMATLAAALATTALGAPIEDHGPAKVAAMNGAHHPPVAMTTQAPDEQTPKVVPPVAPADDGYRLHGNERKL